MSRAVVAAVLAVGACASPVGQAPPPAAQAPAPGGVRSGTGPARAIVPANASRVTAVVLKHTTYLPGTLAAPPPVLPSATYYSLTLDVRSATAARADALSLAQPGVIEAFSQQPLPADLDGRRVDAVVRLAGDTLGSRWLLVELHPIND
jgi:hypothetical protein